ncbi:MAG: hypothetical protein AAGC46_12810 [Solirubrobacteraceae bacterium]
MRFDAQEHGLVGLDQGARGVAGERDHVVGPPDVVREGDCARGGVDVDGERGGDRLLDGEVVAVHQGEAVVQEGGAAVGRVEVREPGADEPAARELGDPERRAGDLERGRGEQPGGAADLRHRG